MTNQAKHLPYVLVTASGQWALLGGHQGDQDGLLMIGYSAVQHALHPNEVDLEDRCSLNNIKCTASSDSRTGSHHNLHSLPFVGMWLQCMQ